MFQKSKLNRDEIGSLLLIAAIIFGAFFRLMPAWMAGFPINDGGMFYTMILDLQANQYLPPLYTTYNNIAIPYTYPPLGFYIGALLSDLFKVSPLPILRWLPGILSTLCIPAIYLFAKEVLRDNLTGAIAALVFAFIPHMSTWLSMGGGLTRSLGTLFMILTIHYVYRLFSSKEPPRSAFLSAITFAGLTILSHTESSVFALTISMYIWLMKSRSWKGLAQGAIVAAGVILVCAPWLGLQIYRHGPAPFFSALQTGGHSLGSVIKLINIDAMTEERYVDILGAAGILGCVFLIARKDYFVPALMALIYIAEPRSAHTIGNIPLALAASHFVMEVTSQKTEISRALLAVTLPFLLINSVFLGQELSRSRVSEDELSAMTWINENLPLGAKFIVLNGETEPKCDALTEWFPAMAKRTSVATMQGREWVLGNQFVTFISQRDALQGCMNADPVCLTTMMEYFDEADYIFISSQRNCSAPETSASSPPLITALADTPNFRLAYTSDQVYIFSMQTNEVFHSVP